jgi:hypothetical protein
MRTMRSSERLPLLTTCIHRSELHFTDHWHTQTSVFGLLQSPLAVSWKRLLPREILLLPAFRFSCQLTTKWVPVWWPLHTTLHRQTYNWQLKSLTHQPATSRHFTQLNCCQLLTLQLEWCCLQHFGMNHTQTPFPLLQSNNTLTVECISVDAGTHLLSSCLAIARVLSTCLPATA